MAVAPALSFWANVPFPAGDDDACWIWCGTINNGYGLFFDEGRSEYAHRVAYLSIHPKIPAGREVSHTCHNQDKNCEGGWQCPHRRCVNPGHLKAATRRNSRRRGRTSLNGAHERAKTHCPKGHAYDAVNTHLARGRRVCRACGRERAKERYHAAL